MEPFGALFDQNGLRSVEMPVLLYRAEQSDLAAEGNILALAAGLPRPPRQQITPGGHFIFVDPCPALVETAAPAACKDAAGGDRTAYSQPIPTEDRNFFHPKPF